MYKVKCPKKECTEDYTEETERNLIEHVKDHSDKDTKSHLFKHAIQTKQKITLLEDFKIIGKE